MLTARFLPPRAFSSIPLLVSALVVVVVVPHSPAATGGGLTLTVTPAAGGAADTTATPGVTLFVAPGQSPTPFLPPGRFEASWSGAIHAELRASFRFRADLRGALRVEINGTNVLDATGQGGSSPLSGPVQLNKGSNAFRAVFRSPADGEAFVRLSWTESGTNTSPIPPSAFTSTPVPERAAQLRLGRELFLEHRCAHCHLEARPPAGGIPELAMDAPALDGIGARRHYDWMRQWVLDPKSLRPSATMPKLLHGPTAAEEAEAIAAFLASLQSGGEVNPPGRAYQTLQARPKAEEGETPAPAGDAAPLYERLQCAACHNPPGTAQPDPAKLSQQRIATKFPPGRLAEYLRAPEARYAWTRMPNFHLSAAEAKELEDWLFAAAPKPDLKPAPTDAARIDKGRALVQSKGCLNCHSLKLENSFAVAKSASLEGRHRKDRTATPAGDCLGTAPAADYGFSAAQRAALDAFTREGMPSLARAVPADFAERQTRLLNCAACHGQFEGFPPLDLLGAKLKPEWMAKFIGGGIPHKLRYDAHPTGLPWLAARMPAFPSRASALAAGLAAQAGYPAVSPPEPPVDTTLAEAGRKLVGKDGGLSCIQCHAVGPLLAMDVFESEGLNLAWSAERLQPEFYRRWLRAPLSVDPQTKMPTYFEDGRSPITDVLDGDGERQIRAIWEYLRLGEKMPAPRTAAE